MEHNLDTHTVLATHLHSVGDVSDRQRADRLGMVVTLVASSLTCCEDDKAEQIMHAVAIAVDSLYMSRTRAPQTQRWTSAPSLADADALSRPASTPASPPDSPSACTYPADPASPLPSPFDSQSARASSVDPTSPLPSPFDSPSACASSVDSASPLASPPGSPSPTASPSASPPPLPEKTPPLPEKTGSYTVMRRLSRRRAMSLTSQTNDTPLSPIDGYLPPTASPPSPPLPSRNPSPGGTLPPRGVNWTKNAAYGSAVEHAYEEIEDL